MTARRRDSGAVLLLVLIIVTVLGVATLAIAQLTFAAPKAAKAVGAKERLLNVLDSGIAGATENLRMNGPCPTPAPTPTPSPTPGPTPTPTPTPLPSPTPPTYFLKVTNADGLASQPPLDVVVTCSGSGPYTLTAAGYITDGDCDGAAHGTGQALVARILMPDVGGRPVPRITERRPDTAAGTCDPEPP